MNTDLVCGMKVDEKSQHHLEHAGEQYYFCSQHCLKKFQANPTEYIKPRAPHTVTVASGAHAQHAAKPVQAAGGYTCPMHPEVRQPGPGSCPICGMALEPRNASAEDNAELRDMTLRFWVSASLAAPVFILATVSDLVPQTIPKSVSMTMLQWIEFALSTPAVLWAGWPIFRLGWASVVNRSLNMFTLIALGVGVAWIYSVVAMLLPGIFPPAMRSMMGTVPVYFEAAAVIMALVLLGQVMELRAQPDQRGDQTAAGSRAQDCAYRAP